MHLLLTVVLCFLTLPALSHAEVKNLALNRETLMTSQWGHHDKHRGNDGKLETMAHTKKNNPAWWCVKLDHIYKLLLITVYNQIGSVIARMRNFEIRISDADSCSTNGFKIARVCHKDSSGSKPVYYIASCNQGGDFSGRYIFINTAGNNYLNMRDMVVYGYTLVNLALNKPSLLSTVYGHERASRGNDGDLKTMAQSRLNNPSWWCVQLDKIYMFTVIKVYNRLGSSMSRLKDFDIRLGSFFGCSTPGFNDAKVCHKDSSGSKGYYEVRSCNQGGEFTGHSVYINTAGKQYLNIRDVQVFGQAFINLALKKPTLSSSVWNRRAASLGNDGAFNTMVITLKNNPAWWCVKLDKIYKFSFIQVFNPTGTAIDRMRNFEIRVSDWDVCSAAGFLKARVCHKDSSGSKDVYYIRSCNRGGDFSGRFIYINTAYNEHLNMREMNVYGRTKYNLALAKPAYGSSRYPKYYSSYGNDGKLSTMAHTLKNNPAWWCVNLVDIYRFSYIQVNNRLGTAQGRMRQFEIRTSEFDGCSAAGYLKARLCHKDTSGSKGIYIITSCNQGSDFNGRYVYINTAGNEYLNMRDMYVYGYVDHNLALKQPAYSSSVYRSNLPSRGNDGALDTMAHTQRNSPAWWCVKLPTIYTFTTINVYNQIGSVQIRMKNFEIRVSDWDVCSAAGFLNARVCHKDSSGSKGYYYVGSCNQGGDFSGRYVYINTGRTDYFNMREFQVYGYVKYPDNVALRQPAVLSSTRNDLVASNGNDGDISSLAHSNYHNPSWWCVRLPTIYNLIKIIIYNRGDRHNTRLSGFQIRVSEFKSCSAANFNSARVCHKDSTGAHNVYEVNGCNQDGDFAGRYVYLNIPAIGSLSFKELQVFGKDMNVLPNVARHRFTRQSSTNGGASELSVDGDVDTCTRTDTNRQAWLCVDLDKMYMLDNILIIQADSGAVSGYEVRLDRVNYCSPDGFNEATLCYRDTIGETIINGCNQGSDIKLDARAIYISVPNKSLSVCEFKAYPVIGPSCDLEA